MGSLKADRDPGQDRQQAARQLAAARRRLFLASTAVGLLAAWGLWASGLSRGWWQWLTTEPLGPFASLIIYVLVVLAALALLALPFSWYGGYRLAHLFGLSRQTPRAWLADWLKATMLGLLFSSLAVLVLYASLAAIGHLWWLVFAAVASLAMVLLTFVAPYLLVPIFYRMRPLENEAVVAAVRRLCAAAHAAVREVCTLDFSRKTVEANAAVIGLGRSRRVVLADTLLSEFSLPEVEAIVAHELGHHVKRHVLWLLLIQAALLWVGLGLAALAGDWLLTATGAPGGLTDPANLPLLLLATEAYGLLALPLGNALSRRLEADADEFAFQLTGDPPAFANAMRKLANQNLAEEQPPRWAEILLHSHPPIARRIQRAEELQRGRAA